MVNNKNFQKNFTNLIFYRKSEKPKNKFEVDLRIDRGLLLGTQVGKINHNKISRK